MRNVAQAFGGVCLAGLLLVWGLSGDIQGQGKRGQTHKRNPQTTVIIHYDDGHAEKPPWAGGPGGGEDPAPQGNGISYSFIGGVWADSNPNLHFEIDLSGFPAGSFEAIMDSFNAWEEVTAGNLLGSFDITPGVDVVLGDGINTYSMRNLGGGGVLAATYITWDDTIPNGQIDIGEKFMEMDVIHNYTVKWGTDDYTPKGKWWDVRNVATHEIGHVYGLGHSGNDEPADYEQTMFASAPAKETKKRTLEAGDIEGIQHPFLGYGAP